RVAGIESWAVHRAGLPVQACRRSLDAWVRRRRHRPAARFRLVARVQELFDLHGKVAIVTGGGSGLGRQMAEALAECGADLVLCARKAERCEQAAAEVSGLGVRALGLACDIRDPEQIEAVVARTVDELGRLDVLVNNAGT